MAREYFNAYHSYLKSMEELNDAECGRLFRACLKYSMTSEAQKLPGGERILFPAIREQIDRDKAAYADKCLKQSQNARMRWDAVACDGMPNDAKYAKEKEKEKEDITLSIISPEKPPAHQRGDHGYVKLTDAEYERLIADLGAAEVARIIAYVDESAAATNNKNKWRDWNLVLRKAAREGWGKKTAGAQTSRVSRALGHSQRKYSAAELDKIGIDLLEDGL